MPRWLPKVLTRVQALAAEGRIRLTAKADGELAALGLDPEDVRDVLMSLSWADSAGRQVSDATGEWMYIFKPRIGAELAYIEVILRSECVVVSFHEDEGEA